MFIQKNKYHNIYKKVYSFTFTLLGLTFSTYSEIDGLVAYLPFDSAYTDVSGSGNHAIPHDVAFSAGFKGNATTGIEFNGTTSYITITNSRSIDFSAVTKPRSVSFWVKPKDTQSEMNILKKTRQFDFYLRDNKIFFEIYPSNTASTNTIMPGAWYHIVGVYNGTTGFLYVNGKLASQIAFTPGNSMVDSLYIGCGQVTSQNMKYSGCIDELKIFNRALTGNEVVSLYEGKIMNTTGILFSSDFTDTNLSKYETVFPENGIWEVSNGVCTVNRTGPSGALVVKDTFYCKNFELSASIMMGSSYTNNDRGSVGIELFNGAQRTHFSFGLMNAGSMHVQGTKRWVIIGPEGLEDPEEHITSENTYGWNDNTFYNLKVKKYNDTWDFFIDGELVTTKTASIIFDRILLGLHFYHSSAVYDNFLLVDSDSGLTKSHIENSNNSFSVPVSKWYLTQGGQIVFPNSTMLISSIKSFKVYDCTGRNVLTKHVNSLNATSLDISCLKSGTYVVKMTLKNSYIYQKINILK